MAGNHGSDLAKSSDGGVSTVKIGNVLIKRTAVLAPMAGVADTAYRIMCKRYNAAFVTSEMVSSKGICYSDKKTNRLMKISEFERPMAIQLFGDDPYFMAKAVTIALQYAPDIIDINMGCPVPKVAGAGSGSALMKNPLLAQSIVEAAVAASTVPVTVKIRKGWDDSSVNAVEFSKMLEQAGAGAITVHGRTRQQMYHPPVDLDIIRAVKHAVSVPVIGNGGITTPQEAQAMYDYTGCDLVMIGQGSYGKPYIFDKVARYLSSKELTYEPTTAKRLEIMLTHIKLIVENKGEESGMREARKHAAWYIKGIDGAASFRNACSYLERLEDLEQLINEVIAT